MILRCQWDRNNNAQIDHEDMQEVPLSEDENEEVDGPLRWLNDVNLVKMELQSDSINIIGTHNLYYRIAKKYLSLKSRLFTSAAIMENEKFGYAISKIQV